MKRIQVALEVKKDAVAKSIGALERTPNYEDKRDTKISSKFPGFMRIQYFTKF